MKTHFTLSDEAGALVLLLVAIACAALLFWLPRSIAPVELPALQLSKSEVAAVIRADAAAAARAPSNSKTAALDALLLEQGRIEQLGEEDQMSYDARRKQLRREYLDLVSELGEEAALTLRAKAMQRFEAALDLKMPLAKAQVVLGAMNSILDRDGGSVDGIMTAPRFAVRTMYKARWNMLHGRAPDYRFEPVEKRSFYGWEALHVERLALAKRGEALAMYQRAGGVNGQEAWGVLAFRAGQWPQAAQFLEAAYRATPSLRLRNYAAGARSAIGSENRGP